MSVPFLFCNIKGLLILFKIAIFVLYPIKINKIEEKNEIISNKKIFIIF